MLADVAHFDALGEHRTATPADHATSQWLAARLGAAGMAVSLQSFPCPLFTPIECRISIGGRSIVVFPAWPVVPTPAVGLTAPLVSSDATLLAGAIALVRLPHRPGGSWGAPGIRAPVMDAIARGAVAAVAVTEGPTGEVIALNAMPPDVDWPVPVVIVGGAAGEALARAAASDATASLRVLGTLTPEATATNVIARRPGRGTTIAVSTPKSGWFQCAGERGSGVAVFLALAEWLTRSTDASLLFVAFSGHELGYRGGAHVLQSGTTAREEIRLWLHIGANAATRDLDIENGAPVTRIRSEPFRRVTAHPTLLSAAGEAFTAKAGYGEPAPISAANAPGEMTLFHAVGYEPIVALGGRNPLFHTRLDRADVVTTAEDLAAVASAGGAFLKSVL